MRCREKIMSFGHFSMSFSLISMSFRNRKQNLSSELLVYRCNYHMGYDKLWLLHILLWDRGVKVWVLTPYLWLLYMDLWEKGCFFMCFIYIFFYILLRYRYYLVIIDFFLIMSQRKRKKFLKELNILSVPPFKKKIGSLSI